jgi:hypothetical protein
LQHHQIKAGCQFGVVPEWNQGKIKKKRIRNNEEYLQVDRFLLIYYATTEDEDGLSETVLGLNARAEVTLFPGGGPLELRCTATVQERTWATTSTALLARLSNQKLAQDDTSAATAGCKFETKLEKILLKILHFRFEFQWSYRHANIVTDLSLELVMLLLKTIIRPHFVWFKSSAEIIKFYILAIILPIL